MKFKSSQEAIGRANRMKQALDLSHHSAFEKEFGDWDSTQAAYYTYIYLGQTVKLRYNQSSGLWTAICDGLSIETYFQHETPEGIASQLEAWMGKHINLAQVELAGRHNVSIEEALVIYGERASL